MKSFLRNPIVSSIIGWLIWLYMAICNHTIRWTIEGEEQAESCWSSQSGVIVAAWHCSILLLPSGWNRVIRKWSFKKPRAAMLISLSKDGEAVANAIRHLGLEAVRGSSANKKKNKDKGGTRALTEALRILKGGGAVCITPDGPRGPARVAQNGPIIMAQRTGAPILPYAIVSSPTKHLKSWDSFRIPYPFSRGAIVFGTPVTPTKDDDRETLRLRLEASLNTAMDRADTLAQKKGRPKERPEV